MTKGWWQLVLLCLIVYGFIALYYWVMRTPADACWGSQCYGVQDPYATLP
jgi:hypothetical protein